MELSGTGENVKQVSAGDSQTESGGAIICRFVRVEDCPRAWEFSRQMLQPIARRSAVGRGLKRE